jgi:hypothetical protein
MFAVLHTVFGVGDWQTSRELLINPGFHFRQFNA